MRRIWIYFGIYMAIASIASVAVLTASLLLRENEQFESFLNTLPINTFTEMVQLAGNDQRCSPRALEIYNKFWPVGPTENESFLLIHYLLITLLMSFLAAFLLARNFARPVMSLAEAAHQISQGDFSVRAKSFDRDNELSGMVANFNRMADTLERLQNERRTTAAAISHELRTPLTIMQGRLHALADGVISTGPNEYKRLLEQTEHLVRLVEDVHVLDMSSIEQLAMHCTEVDLSVLIQDTLDLYKERIASHGMNVVLHAQHLPVFADSARIRQVLANLIENTLRYASSGKALDVFMRSEKGMAIIELSDRGPGFPSGINEQIFDPFFRLDDSRSRATGGSGLGLSVVRALLRQHDGSVIAFNREGGGATFRVTLPMRHA